MKSFFEDLGRKIGETAETVTNKAGEAVEVQRLKNQIRTLERGNERDYMELGRMVYDHYKDGEVVDAEAIGICEAIENREESIGKYEQQISDVKGDVTCDGCGKSVSRDMAYCPYCGAKAPEKAEQEATDYAEAVKEKVVDAAEKVKETAENVAEAVKEKAETFREKTDDSSEAVKEKTMDAAETVKEKTADAAETVKEKTADAAETIKEKAAEAADMMRDKTADAADVVKEKTADFAESAKKMAEEAEEKVKRMMED